MNIPKTLPCILCGVKPKRQIVSWSYGDSDDELFLVHKCKRGEVMRYPPRGTFTTWRVNGQEPKVIEEWNRLNAA
jgi:hypothetical protein